MRTTQEHEEEQLMNAAKKATAWNLLFAMITVVIVNSIPVSAQEATASGMYEEQLAKAVELLEKNEFSAAAKAYRKANALAGGTSAEALVGFATACYQIETLKRAVFEPATLNGKPVAVYYNWTNNFRLTDPRTRRR